MLEALHPCSPCGTKKTHTRSRYPVVSSRKVDSIRSWSQNTSSYVTFFKYPCTNEARPSFFLLEVFQPLINISVFLFIYIFRTGYMLWFQLLFIVSMNSLWAFLHKKGWKCLTIGHEIATIPSKNPWSQAQPDLVLILSFHCGATWLNWCTQYCHIGLTERPSALTFPSSPAQRVPHPNEACVQPGSTSRGCSLTPGPDETKLDLATHISCNLLRQDHPRRPGWNGYSNIQQQPCGGEKGGGWRGLRGTKPESGSDERGGSHSLVSANNNVT